MLVSKVGFLKGLCFCVITSLITISKSEAEAFINCPSPQSIQTNVHTVRYDAKIYSVNLNHFHTDCEIIASGSTFFTSYTIDSLTLKSSPINIRPFILPSLNSFSMNFKDTGYDALNGNYSFTYNVKFYVKNTSGGFTTLAYPRTINVAITNGVNPVVTPAPTPTTRPIQPTPTPIVPYIPPYANVTVTNPISGQKVSGIIPVDFTINNIRGLTIRSVSIHPYTGELAGSTRSIQLDTRKMPEGNRSIEVRVFGLDNRQLPAYFFGNVLLDVQNGTPNQPTPAPTNPAPSISILGLENNQTINGSHKFAVTASDNEALKTFEVNGFGKVLISKDLANSKNTHTEEFIIDTTQFTDGTYAVNVTATDNQGGSSHALRIFLVSNATLQDPSAPSPIPAPLPETPNIDTLAKLINTLSELMVKISELLKELLKVAELNPEQAKLTRAVVNSYSDLANVNKEQFESNDQTKHLPVQAKNVKKSVNKALKLAKNNDKEAFKKELGKARRLLTKTVKSLR